MDLIEFRRKMSKTSIKFSSLEKRTNTLLPEIHFCAHQLSFIVHDVMTQLLVSGEKASVFHMTFEFKDDADRQAFESAGDVFTWLEQTRRIDERAALLVSTVFPVVLSDMLHCFYEALETSRKAKLNVSYILLRKPLQESLFLLESIAVDHHTFAETLATDPLRLRGQKAGGLEVHSKRIQAVLDKIGESHRFDAGYLPQLRYEKGEDGFDGICNQATHLFTAHPAIKTAPLNVNFIFSGWDAKLTQRGYLYSRLPYILAYIYSIAEYVSGMIIKSNPEYIDDMKRRIYSLVLLWWDTVEQPYNEPRLLHFVMKTRDWLFRNCNEAGYRDPTRADLASMAHSGAYPGEGRRRVTKRIRGFERAAAANRLEASLPRRNDLAVVNRA